MTTALAPASASASTEPFDLDAYLCGIDTRLLGVAEGRRALCALDPLLFALLYFPHHLRSSETGEQISFSEFHIDLCEAAKRWHRQNLGPAEIREAWVAPRGSGKSSWSFLILPLWALAHGHRRYCAAFADSATQAEQHLTSVKRELEGNALLRYDYPDLCAPAIRLKGSNVSDNRALYVARSGAVFSAKGIDSSVLGAKVGSRRPDLLTLDDTEPDEANYSVYQKDKRLGTILNTILPMNDRAVVQIVGTTTMPGSIIDDLVKSTVLIEPADWVRDEKIVARIYPALITDPETGEERSMWPQRWGLEYLQSIRHTRSFMLNLQNDPLARDGDYWTLDDIRHGTLPALTHQVLSIDPAVTSKERSDFTALAVIGFYAPERRAVVRDAWALRVAPGEALRARVLAILETFPNIAGVLVESNQGGDTWKAILHHLPVPVRTVHQTAPKEVRAARLLNHYQLGRVVHERRLLEAEAQLVSFPKGVHDDLVDVIGQGVEVFLGKKKQANVTSGSYL